MATLGAFGPQSWIWRLISTSHAHGCCRDLLKSTVDQLIIGGPINRQIFSIENIAVKFTSFADKKNGSEFQNLGLEFWNSDLLAIGNGILVLQSNGPSQLVSAKRMIDLYDTL